MVLIKPIPDCDWFEIDEDQYLMFLLKGYEIKLSRSKELVYFLLDGKYHREDGPAVIWNGGGVEYFQNDKRHCEHGPAVIWNGGVEYWLNDIKYTKEDYYKALKDGNY